MKFEKYTKNLNHKIDFKIKNKIKNIDSKMNNLTKKMNKLENLLNRYNGFIWNHSKFFRYTTYPFNKLWINKWLASIQNSKNHYICEEPGIHFWNAKQGGGKSSCLFHIAKANLMNNNKGAYLFTKLEKPKTDDKGMYVYHRYVEDVSIFFNERKQKIAFDVAHFNILIWDEFYFYFNHRFNKSN